MGRVYIVGTGFIGRHHADAVAELPADPRCKGADPDPEARAAFADAFPDAEVYEDPEAMLAEPANEDDIVVLATPPVARRDLAVAALESGRHVLCEKPFAMSREEASDILTAARRHDRLVGTATARHAAYPHTEAVRDLIVNGEVGRPYHATFIDRARRARTGIEYQPERRWPLDESIAGGGVLMNWGAYDFATLNHVLSPRRVTVDQAWVESPETDHDLPEDRTYDVEQHAGASMRYETDTGGWTVAVTYERADCTHGTEDRRFEIEGTEGAVRWNWKDCHGTVSLVRQFDAAAEPREEERTFEVEDPAPGSRPLVFFDRRVRGEDAFIPVNEQAVFNLACIRSVYEVAETGEPTVVDRSAR
jgi:predicted dehydrogenase